MRRLQKERPPSQAARSETVLTTNPTATTHNCKRFVADGTLKPGGLLMSTQELALIDIFARSASIS